ncbi:hypothetical protein MUK42_28701 [Musa troglodytarum]|uniref:Uncharacterized protein n=1 Tax=Musa troglodytarum TaxID=320322 RepID=A0A9E7G0Q5_9LILI|nr:hypothetical protein MUK42_28701 [Musa troglodytarum]
MYYVSIWLAKNLIPSKCRFIAPSIARDQLQAVIVRTAMEDISDALPTPSDVGLTSRVSIQQCSGL